MVTTEETGNRAEERIPLLSCQRDATGHKAIFAFHGIDND